MSNEDIRQRTVKRVVIAGGGTAGWMAAAALSRMLGRVLDITLVESEEIGTIGVGEATIPTLVTFHRLLEINEAEFMAATQATLKLGISFENWREPGHRYIHSFGTTGKDHWMATFHHFWKRAHEAGLAGRYDDYCVELRAAEESRFAHLPRQGMNYAYHLDAGLYARFLRRFSEGFGTKRVEGKIAEVVTDPESGYITALKMADGNEIEGDLFIDCTGFQALLIGKALNIGYTDWSHWLLNDSALPVQTMSVRDAVPYTRSIAGKAGWQWRIPLQHRAGNGIVYSSRYMSDDEAKEELMSSIEGEVIREPRPIRFRPGQRNKSWNRNCIALGLSAGFIEPLESTTIHLIQRGITRLLNCFPHVISQPIIDDYNARMESELHQARDFVILHYAVSNRRDSTYWRTVANMELPPALRQRIEMFRETGNVFHVPTELFQENSWIQVMMGQGITPRQHHPVADVMSNDELAHFLATIKQNVEQTVRQLPPHMDYVRSYAPGVAS